MSLLKTSRIFKIGPVHIGPQLYNSAKKPYSLIETVAVMIKLETLKDFSIRVFSCFHFCNSLIRSKETSGIKLSRNNVWFNSTCYHHPFPPRTYPPDLLFFILFYRAVYSPPPSTYRGNSPPEDPPLVTQQKHLLNIVPLHQDLCFTNNSCISRFVWCISVLLLI